MKRNVFILFLSLLCATINAQVVEKIYKFDEPEIVSIDNYSLIKFPGSQQYAEAGSPSLPYQPVSLLLPMGYDAESVEVQFLDFKEIEGSYMLYPYQQAVPYSKADKFKFEKNEQIYSYKGDYPSKSHNDVSTHYLNGHSFAFLNFTPVQYIPSEGKIRYAQKVRVSVKTSTEREDHSAMLWNTPSLTQSVTNLAQNPEMVSSYKHRGASLPNYEILVITAENYVAGFDEYIEHYNSMGYRTRLVTVEYIYSQTTGIDEQEQIRNYIIKEYQDNGIMMVMLGGDVNIIPYRGLYCMVSEEYVDEGIPADLYYAALDGTWNDNENSFWGEWFESDLLPEIGIARLSFANEEEQHNMIHKTLSYQRNPIMGEFRDITLGSEIMDDTPTYGGDFLELIIGKCDEHGYGTIGIPEDYNFTRIYEEHDNWSGENLAKAINKGTQYVHHAGHANSDFVAGWYLSDITDDNFHDVNGTDHNYTFFHSHGCICGAFDEDCIMERMIKIENFCVAVSGNSRYGWYCPGGWDGPSIHLHRELVDAQYNDKLNNLAMSLRESKIQTAPLVGNFDATRWNYYDLNVLGDGAAPIWLDEPFETNIDCETYLMVGTESIKLTVTDNDGKPMEGFRCSYFSSDNELTGFAMTDKDGVAEIIFESALSEDGYANIIVTGPNAFPNRKEVIIYKTDTPFVIMDNYSFNDNDGQLDYSESHIMNMSFKNVGDNNASYVEATLTCDKPEYVNITNSTVNVGDVATDNVVNLENAFAFTICDSVPNNTKVRFFVTCNDGTEEWESKFDVNISAPEFEIVNPAGLELNPGDVATVEFTIVNKGGSDANNIVFLIFPPEETSLDQTEFKIASMASGEEMKIELMLTVSEDALLGYAYEMPTAVYSGRYITTDSYAVSIGAISEDFETGDFTKFDWEHNSLTSWSVVSNEAYEGQYCAKSASITDMSSSVLKITLDVKVDSDISFYKKVSSETNYDFLEFYIDDKKIGVWSGEIDWSLEEYVLEKGLHTLKWVYTKDVSYNGGQDCAWIDNIKLPPVSVIVDVETVEEKNIEIYPNPNNGVFNISLGDLNSYVTIYNAMGQIVYQMSDMTNDVEINLGDISPSLYFINIKNSEIDYTEKIVVR